MPLVSLNGAKRQSELRQRGIHMERVHQVVGTEGLRIPLPVIKQYGLQPGAGVVLELRADTIHILLPVPGQEEIESRALRFLLSHLGDATTVKAERDGGDWSVSVYGAGLADPVGWLAYSPTGEIYADRSTTVEEMRQLTKGKAPRS